MLGKKKVWGKNRMEIKWNKFKGTIKGSGCDCTIEMMDLFEPQWFARFFRANEEEMEMAINSFEEGELDQAHKWCEKQITDYEQRKGKDTRD